LNLIRCQVYQLRFTLRICDSCTLDAAIPNAVHDEPGVYLSQIYCFVNEAYGT